MALCDSHVAGCGEHPPAWGLRDDRLPGTDQAVRGGRHGQKLHSGTPPRGRGVPAVVRMPCLSWQKVERREANRRRHRLTEPTTEALWQPPPPPDPPPLLPFHCLRLTAKILLRRLRCQEDLRFKILGGDERGTLGGGGVPAKPPAPRPF